MPRRPRTSRITIEDLRERIRAGSLREQEMGLYFRKDEESSEAFAPAVQVNEARVDLRGETVTADDARELLEQAMLADAARQAEKARAVPEGLGQPLRIAAEGDSWFNLPPVGWPQTALDVLKQDFAVSSVAMWGDEIEDMVARKQYRQLLQSKLYRHFLFSGGGNDVLGSIPRYVGRRKSGDVDPANAGTYVRQTFQTKVREIIALYEDVAADTRRWGPPGCILYVHGYANAVPRAGGKYLGKPLKGLDFDAVTHAPLARAVVAELIARFNTALAGFAAATANVVYLDMRSAMGAGDWNSDEIHPRLSGSRRIAARFKAAIEAHEPSV